jgi:dTDP-4-amino-4,6-dideoxygalactose transaminase
VSRRRAHVPSPTVGGSELLRALARPMDVENCERAAERILGVPHAVVFGSARGGLAACVAVLAPEGRIGIPGYTCVAVPYAVEKGGGRPVYADVDERGLVPAGAWPEADALLLQDTYGFAAEVPPGRSVVRDATHRADALLEGSAGTVRVTSFEHSKTLSAGQGGVAVTADAELARGLREWRDRQPPTPRGPRHGLVTALMLAMGRLDYRGRRVAALPLKAVLRVLAPQRMGVESSVDRAGTDAALGRPGRVSARLIASQLLRMQALVDHRRRVVSIYDRAAGVQRDPDPLIRYPMITADPAAFEARLARSGWDVSGRWFATPLHPIPPGAGAFGYSSGTAPAAERLAREVVNLPTHPLVSDRDAGELIELALAAGARPLA